MQLAVSGLTRCLRRFGVVLIALLALQLDGDIARPQTTEIPASQGQAATAPANRWTFFVWMAADNDLEPQGIEDLKEMELGIPAEGVEIIVFVDRFTPNNKRFGDWSGGRLYRIRPNRVRETFTSELLHDFGPVNSSDPRTESTAVRAPSVPSRASAG